jgi:TonB-dependent starch-binding outer membrane protein SusC
MKNRLLTCLSLILVLTASSVLAQSGGIRGKVIDASNGESLPNANIVVKELNRGASSDINGNYAITNIPAGTYTVESSFVGYKRFSTRVTIGEGTVTLNINFEPALVGLDELVVTGYSVTTKREVTGAITQVKADQIENLPIQTFDQALQGRAAGVQVTSASGQPGGAIRVRIRGFGSINASNQPLYIVDGVQLTENSQGSSQASSNPLAALNPNDILSIEILKDAAAASIYGAQAANGVILITTKQGRAGSSVITVNSTMGWTSQPRFYETMDSPTWLNFMMEAYENHAKVTLGNVQAARNLVLTSFLPGCTAAGIGTAPCDPNQAVTYDWQRAVYQTGVNREIDASLSGGTDITRFFLSTGFENSEGQAKFTDFKRMSLRANVDHRVNSKMTVESRINLASTRQFGAVADGNFINGPFFMGAWQQPTRPIYNADGSFNENVPYANIVLYQQLDQRKTRGNDIQGSLAFNYKLPQNVILRVFGGLNFRQTRDTNYRSALIPGAPRTNGGDLFEANREIFSYNVNATLNYNKSFNNVHNVSALLGSEYKEESQEAFTAAGRGFANPLFDILSLAATPAGVSGTATEFKAASVFGQVKYDYGNRYLLNATARYDGSSRFGVDNRWGLFYAFSGAWNLANEEFIPLPDAINDMKLRAGYGITGNSGIGNFASRSLFGSGGSYNSGAGLRPSQLANNILTWEEAKTINAGLDFAILDSRISGSLDLYRKRNERLLLGRSLPSDSGFGSITENAGVVQNQGYEFEITSRNVDRDNFLWTSSFNITSNQNELIALNAGQTRIGNSYIVGEPLRYYWGYKWAGVNPADGRPMWYDVNGNITYLVQAADEGIISYLDPTHYGGFNNTFSYKGLTLDVFFQYDLGGNTFEQQVGYFLMDPGTAGGLLTRLLDRWTTPGQITDVEKAFRTRNEPGMSSRTTGSTWYIESTSYIRLKNATLSYSLPDNVVSRLGIRNFKVFATGQNLYTWTAYSGLDPEFLDTAAAPYPQGRTIRTGVQLQF